MHHRRNGIRREVLLASALLAAVLVWHARAAYAQTTAQPLPAAPAIHPGLGPPVRLDLPEDALAAYVNAPDDTYRWHERAEYRRRGAQIVELVLHSQTWRDTLWKHQLVLIKPRRIVNPEHGVLIIGGGRWRAEYDEVPEAPELPDGAGMFLRIAEKMSAVLVVLGQVPHQPLFDMTEDKLIAYTFDRYLKSGDPQWPLLLPMVKSAVRAMDAGSDAARERWGRPIERYTVIGGSKRGWTTWLLAAVDERATGIVPAVIDALNMQQHFAHQSEVFGAPSEEIRPYTELDLHTVFGSDAGEGLRRIVDPYAYRDRIRQPKLVVIATNDAYFPLDSANLYWDDLPEPKYLLYLPNDEHSIGDYRRLIAGARALHASLDGGPALPRYRWEYRWNDDAVELCVEAEPRPASLRLWRAESESRDFRNASWRAERPVAGGTVTIPRPAQGYSATFAEVGFGRGRSAYSLSTNVAVIAPIASADVTPQAAGGGAICRATP